VLLPNILDRVLTILDGCVVVESSISLFSQDLGMYMDELIDSAMIVKGPSEDETTTECPSLGISAPVGCRPTSLDGGENYKYFQYNNSNVFPFTAPSSIGTCLSDRRQSYN